MAKKKAKKRSRAAPAAVPAQSGQPDADDPSDAEDFVVQRTPAKKSPREQRQRQPVFDDDEDEAQQDGSDEQAAAARPDSAVPQTATPRKRLRKVNESRAQTVATNQGPHEDMSGRRRLRPPKTTATPGSGTPRPLPPSAYHRTFRNSLLFRISRCGSVANIHIRAHAFQVSRSASRPHSASTASSSTLLPTARRATATQTKATPAATATAQTAATGETATQRRPRAWKTISRRISSTSTAVQADGAATLTAEMQQRPLRWTTQAKT